eukprot:TRINITY_DN39458_c0_g1_i1.p1 TRINITY_DN39458_c0_g1~~TRINITY_DN39458_c0_g1_i1.p1  ORF type:complete len:477 (+),score=135.87 TRINITY_DN39458_c0_g1_i1:67-1497(+)
MPVPLILAGSLGGVACATWAGFTGLFYSRRGYWKETGRSVTAAEPLAKGKKISVIVPAYNEEANIAACAKAVLDCCSREADDFELIVVDDMSKDGTVAAAQKLKEQHPRGHLMTILSAGPRPEGEVWLGKCWAVWQGANKSTGQWLVFVDADVHLKPGGLERAVSVAEAEDCDLLSGDVAFSCGCFAEKLIQPIVLQNLVLNNDHKSVNAPVEVSEMASAAGHIMIFKRDSYFAFGGHGNENIREHVVEDVMLASLVKNHAGGTAKFYDFTSVAEIQMYDSWSELFEGYSKNIYLAHGESAVSVVAVSAVNLVAFALPAALLCWGAVATIPLIKASAGASAAVAAKAGAAGKTAAAAKAGAAAKGSAATAATTAESGATAADAASVGILMGSGSACIAAQWNIRREMEKDGRIASDLWWSQPIGGCVLVGIALVSLFKGVTGIAWTWKGRPLAPEKAMECARQEAAAASIAQQPLD